MKAQNLMVAEVHSGALTAAEATKDLVAPMEMLARYETELCGLLAMVKGNPDRREEIEVVDVGLVPPGERVHGELAAPSRVEIPVRVRVVDMVYAKRKQIEEAAEALHGAYKETIGSVERLMNFDPNPATAAVASDAHG